MGKLLSNFAHTPFECEDGEFQSIEGYWYWLACDDTPDRDKLRDLIGYEAKKYGRQLRAEDYPKDEDFQRKIKAALTAKVYHGSNAKLKRQLFESGDVPIVHYYDYKGKIVEPEEGRWVWEHLSNIRKELQEKQLRIIVAGTRDFDDYHFLRGYLNAMRFKYEEKLGHTLVIISGGAKGADKLGERWAKEHDISFSVFPADWSKHGKAAGPIRNTKMAEVSDALVAFWDGKSRGTKHMIDTAIEKGLMTKVIRYDQEIQRS